MSYLLENVAPIGKKKVVVAAFHTMQMGMMQHFHMDMRPQHQRGDAAPDSWLSYFIMQIEME